MSDRYYGSGRQRDTRSFITSLVNTVLLIVLIVLCSYLVNRIKLVESDVESLQSQSPVPDILCDPPSTQSACRRGTSVTSANGTKICNVYNRPTGASCVDACHIANATTYCTQSQTCVSATASDCLGSCTIDLSNSDWSIVDYASDQCDGKLTFKNFFLPNRTLESSCDAVQWSWFNFGLGENPVGDCQAYGGCTWSATQMLLAYKTTEGGDLEPLDFSINEPGSLSCYEMLNMTNTECLRVTSIPMTETMGNIFFNSLRITYGQNGSIYAPSTNFSGQICVYQYACGASNETAYLQPHYLLGGKKRALVSQEETAAKANYQRRLQRLQQSETARRALHLERAESLFESELPKMLEHMAPHFNTFFANPPDLSRKRSAMNICGT